MGSELSPVLYTLSKKWPPTNESGVLEGDLNEVLSRSLPSIADNMPSSAQTAIQETASLRLLAPDPANVPLPKLSGVYGIFHV